MTAPSPLVLVWEDRNFEKLGQLLRRARHTASGPYHVVLANESAQGNGNFARYTTQRLVLKSPRGQPPPRFVIAIADADRYETLVPNFPPPPITRMEQARWSWNLRQEWTRRLREEARQGGVDDPRRVFGIVLRWSRESVLIASPDAVVEWAGAHQSAAVQEHLLSCKPDPRTHPEAEFACTYRRPGVCLESIARKMKRPGGFKKGVDGEDLLDTQVLKQPQELRKVLSRVPELGALVRLINRLARWSAQS